jgi:hypothetical protein
VAADHWVELELGRDAPTDQPLALLGFGWIHPTDSSINVAMSQGDHPAPSGLVMEVADGKGGWRIAKDGLGFPSGKNKTVVLPLDGVFIKDAPRRLRLRTNLEVYWDQLGWAVLLDEHLATTQRLLPKKAELRYRGFSVIAAKDKTSPEVPAYDKLMGATPRWRDLEGYYTRFGDVLELLEKVDDRYIIMNAGDEVGLRFEDVSAKPKMSRDFVLIVDGWEKDGNYNTDFSRTILPLPRHDWPAYDNIAKRLEDDPAYQRHPEDWVKYQTRYVTADLFKEALRQQK